MKENQVHEVKNQDFDAIKIQTTNSNLSEARIEILKEEWLKNKIKSVNENFYLVITLKKEKKLKKGKGN